MITSWIWTFEWLAIWQIFKASLPLEAYRYCKPNIVYSSRRGRAIVWNLERHESLYAPSPYGKWERFSSPITLRLYLPWSNWSFKIISSLRDPHYIRIDVVSRARFAWTVIRCSFINGTPYNRSSLFYKVRWIWVRFVTVRMWKEGGGGLLKWIWLLFLHGSVTQVRFSRYGLVKVST